MNDQQIFKLADAAGLARHWTSARGEHKQVSAQSLSTILQALGLPCSSESECRASQDRLAALRGADHLPLLVTGTVDVALRLQLPAALGGRIYRIEFEDGGAFEGRVPDDVSHPVELPAIGRFGYHRLRIGDQQTTLAIAPRRCYGVADALSAAGGKPVHERDPGLWGLGVQLYSLRRAGDGGIGDFTALADLGRSAARHGAAALAISPVHAMFSADTNRFSPYSPSSRLFLNVLHIDPASVLGPDALGAAVAAVGSDATARLEQLEQADLIDWPQAGSLRLALLRELYHQFIRGGSDRQEFERFRSEMGGALQDHARFEAIQAWRLARGENGYWVEWPEELRDPRSAAVEQFAKDHAEEVAFHEFLQWQAAKGLSGAQKAAREAGMPIGLIADLAIGADNSGSQAWSRQSEIINGMSVGAPPDLLNVKGQSWGLGAFSPHAMRAKGFAAYIEMLRATFAYAGGARIDHVLGLSRLWLVPHGASAEDGAYLQYPMDDLLRLIALESWRHEAIVIGEDLGTVPEGFDARLAQAGLLGIRVLMFQREGERFLLPTEWPEYAISTTTTHDLPTVAGWWTGRDIDWRLRFDLLESGQTEADARQLREHERKLLWQALTESGCASGSMPDHRADPAPLAPVIEFISAAPSPLAMLPIEDALGLPEQPNLPGTVDDHPNWRRRLAQPVENVLDDDAVSHRLALLNRSRSY